MYPSDWCGPPGGGTIGEAWTSPEGLSTLPEYAQWIKDENAAQPEGPNHPSVLFNAMIHPLIPYGIQGTIWYQGENNSGKAFAYRTLFPALIKSWRDAWGEGDFPFLYVQLAPWISTERDWAELREAQLFALKASPRTAMAVITDYGDCGDVHPRHKEPVGARLALAARKIAYGQDLVYSGPIYKSMKIHDDAMTLSFDHIGSGLTAKGGQLKGFVIAGKDRKFVDAKASIVGGDKVVVSSPNITHPVAVRFGWADCPDVNLFNREGLPASPFRTDDWPTDALCERYCQMLWMEPF